MTEWHVKVAWQAGITEWHVKVAQETVMKSWHNKLAWQGGLIHICTSIEACAKGEIYDMISLIMNASAFTFTFTIMQSGSGISDREDRQTLARKVK